MGPKIERCKTLDGSKKQEMSNLRGVDLLCPGGGWGWGWGWGPIGLWDLFRRRGWVGCARGQGPTGLHPHWRQTVSAPQSVSSHKLEQDTITIWIPQTSESNKWRTNVQPYSMYRMVSYGAALHVCTKPSSGHTGPIHIV